MTNSSSVFLHFMHFTRRSRMELWVTAITLALCTTCAALTQEDNSNLEKELCSRVFLKGLDGGKIAHLQLLGVYVKQNVSWSDLPVYKHEQENLFIYISKSHKTLSIGKQDSSNPILYAQLTNVDIERAISQTDKHPYYSMVEQWFTYDPVNKSYVQLQVSDLKIECVDQDFVLCRSKQMAFRGEIPFAQRNIRSSEEGPATWISDVTTIRLYLLDGGFKNMRPVYEVIGFYNVLYLYYNEYEGWEIADDWIADTIEKFVVFRVFDTALRPEYITGMWQLNSNGTFYDLPEFKLRCRGNPASPDGACIENYPCHNGARCKYVEYSSLSGEIICLCGPTYQGPSCREETPSCTLQSDLEMPDNTLFYSANGNQLGDVMTYFCFPESAKMFFFSKCESKKSENETVEMAWVFHGNCDLTNFANSINSFSITSVSFLLFATILISN